MTHSLRGQRLSPSTQKALFLWGRGSLGRELATFLRSMRIDHRNKIAQALAKNHGCPIGNVGGTWAASITGIADEHEFDRLTRCDPSVMGWTADRDAQCEPSIALRNALNVLNPAERKQSAGALASRFCGSSAHPERAADEWIARDGRLVVFDEALAQWRLGEYITT